MEGSNTKKKVLFKTIAMSPLEKVVYTIECHRVATPLPSRGGVPEGRGGVCNLLSMKNLLTPPPTPPLQGRGVPCGLFRYRFTDVQTFSSGLIYHW